MDREEPDVKQLDRLYDYTKFHIGIYTTLVTVLLAAMSAQVAIIGTCARWFMVPSILGIMLAGLGGGVIASHTPEYPNFSKFKDAPIGFWGFQPWTYYGWARLEHLAFWFSIIFAVAVVVLKPWVGRPPFLGVLSGCG